MTDVINHEDILVLVQQNMKKRGRKPKGPDDTKVWDDHQYRKDYFNDYYKNVVKNKPIQIIQCECGKEYQKIHKSQHNHSKHHKMYMEFQKLLEDKLNNVVEKNNV